MASNPKASMGSYPPSEDHLSVFSRPVDLGTVMALPGHPLGQALLKRSCAGLAPLGTRTQRCRRAPRRAQPGHWGGLSASAPAPEEPCTNYSHPFHLGAFAISHPFTVNINPLPCPSVDLRNSVCLPHFPPEHVFCVMPGLPPAELLPLTTKDVAAPRQRVLQLFACPAFPLSTHCPGRDCKALPKTWRETALVMRCAYREIMCKKNLLQGFQQENTVRC